jgi:hypothetical protein
MRPGGDKIAHLGIFHVGTAAHDRLILIRTLAAQAANRSGVDTNCWWHLSEQKE